MSKCIRLLKSIGPAHIFSICLFLMLITVLVNHGRTTRQMYQDKNLYYQNKRKCDAEMKLLRTESETSKAELNSLDAKHKKCWGDFERVIEKVEAQQVNVDYLKLEMKNKDARIFALESDQEKLQAKFNLIQAETASRKIAKEEVSREIRNKKEKKKRNKDKEEQEEDEDNE